MLCTALCRIFRQDGWRVAPFKSQNMALNSYVTCDGGEIGRAQGVQAEAAGVTATVDMNPILLKPKRDTVAQVIVRGRAIGDMGAGEYGSDYLPIAREIVRSSLERLRRAHQVVIIEGAGSPAEINLMERDIANMKVAEMAQCPVILVADIDRGGAFASIVGTLELLSPDERDRIAGFIINKFRGDIGLLRPALDFIERRTFRPVLGVVPYIHDVGIAQEDSVALSELADRDWLQWAGEMDGTLDIAVVQLPHISNFDDFDPLSQEPDVRLRFVRRREAFGKPDALVIPGTKNTVEDLAYLYRSGQAAEILSLDRLGVPIVGICGGFQMMGRLLRDPMRTESEIEEIDGLGLLPIVTTFRRGKMVNRIRAKVVSGSGFLACLRDEVIEGYEIHTGRSSPSASPSPLAPPSRSTSRSGGAQPLFLFFERSGHDCNELDGMVSEDGLVFGTHLHGLFANDRFRRAWLNFLRELKGLEPLKPRETVNLIGLRERAYDRLAAVVRSNLDMERLYSIVGLPTRS